MQRFINTVLPSLLAVGCFYLIVTSTLLLLHVASLQQTERDQLYNAQQQQQYDAALLHPGVHTCNHDMQLTTYYSNTYLPMLCYANGDRVSLPLN